MKRTARSALLLLVLTVLVLPAAAAKDFGPSSTPLIEGVDISQYQGAVDFEKLREAGVRAAYIRSSLGFSYVDERFAENARAAAAAGLDIGFYHFCTAATIADAQSQADFFVETVRDYPHEFRLVLELSPVRELDAKAFSDVALAFLQRIRERTNDSGAIYCSAYTARDKYDDRLAVYPLWVADYGAREPEGNDTWKSWAGFQYTDRLRVSGIETRVDGDRYTKELYLSPSPSPDPSDCGYLYVVQPGDTLRVIAARFGTTADRIASLNGLPNPDEIYPGQLLRYK